MNLNDIIIGRATPPGRGSISVFRISGKDLRKVLNNTLPLSQIIPRRIYKYLLKDTEGETIDEIMYIFYSAPHSYTGEDIIEIFSHGGYAVEFQIIRLFLSLGLRTAEPGEFTLRAVLNNKMDIIKAEAIDAICKAESIDQFRVARNGLLQKSRDAFDNIYKEFIDAYSGIVASVEFEEEEVERSISSFELQIDSLRSKVSNIISDYESLRYSIEGADVVIAGRTNVGKSSLFNRLIKEERSIVTEIPGTTRDSIDRKVFLNNLPVRYVDTAGLRETEDTVELIGQERSQEEIEKADLILYMVDVDSGVTDIDKEIIQKNLSRLILVVNKIDLKTDFIINGMDNVFYISAKYGIGIDRLRAGIQEFLNKSVLSKKDPLIFNHRQYQIFLNILYLLNRTIELIKDGAVADVIISELNSIRREFERLFGNDILEDLYSNIFSKFCIGK